MEREGNRNRRGKGRGKGRRNEKGLGSEIGWDVLSKCFNDAILTVTLR